MKLFFLLLTMTLTSQAFAIGGAACTLGNGSGLSDGSSCNSGCSGGYKYKYTCNNGNLDSSSITCGSPGAGSVCSGAAMPGPGGKYAPKKR